eukprot:m.78110 g.78110  ORF g.78110 m.78110 type:complete len:235 (+) comp12519_c0_seq1:85-789(+)
MAQLGVIAQSVRDAQQAACAPPVSIIALSNQRIALTESGQLWSERQGPTNAGSGGVGVDICGRGPVVDNPNGHPWGPVPSVRSEQFRGLLCESLASLAWTDKKLYGWGCRQTLSWCEGGAIDIPTVLWAIPEDDDDCIVMATLRDRAALVVTERGRLFGWGNGSWGACLPDTELHTCEDGLVQIPLPFGKEAVGVVLSPYSSNTVLYTKDDCCYKYDQETNSWIHKEITQGEWL